MDDLHTLRAQIDDIDRQLTELFARRMAVADQVGAYKAAHGLPVLDWEREAQLLAHRAALVEEDLREDVTALFETILTLSRRRQQALTDHSAE